MNIFFTFSEANSISLLEPDSQIIQNQEEIVTPSSVQKEIKDNWKLSLMKKINENMDNNPYASDRVIVKFKKGKISEGKSMIQSLLGKEKINSTEFKNLDIGVVYFADKQVNIKEKVKLLNSDPTIEYAEPDYRMTTSSLEGVVTNDPGSIRQWHLKSIQADESWKIYNDNENKTITSVNDTGIDYRHPDLIGNLRDLSSSCKTETGAIIAGGCSKSGRNFESGITALFPKDETFDITGHGTHVAGIIGAVGHNGTGVIGVTQNVELMSARIDSHRSLELYFHISDSIKALDFAIQNNAKIVNASYGGLAFSQSDYDSINRAKSAGILFIAAAGNGGSDQVGDDNDSDPSYPASYDLDNIIAVASIGPNDSLASYSNYGVTSVDIAAPGGQKNRSGEGRILSTYPGKETVFDNSLNTLSGTTISGTGSDWYLFSLGYGFHTQSPLSYTGGVNSSLVFNDSFSLSGSTIATMKGQVSCDFGNGILDTDEGDYLDFNIIDTNTNTEYNIHRFLLDSSYLGNINVTIPISNPNIFKDNLKFKINFVTDSDNDVGAGCRINNLKIFSHSRDNHTYKSIQGTSMAAPVVSGVAAMIWSYKPDLSYTQVKSILLSTVNNLPIGDKILSGGKVSAKNAIKEVIKRYGITKIGTFEAENFDSKLISLDGKNINLSGSTISIFGTGNVIDLKNGANILGTGAIQLGTGITIKSGTSTILSVSDDFTPYFKDSNGNIISSSGQIISGTGIYFSYSGSITGTGIKLKVGNFYDGNLTQNQFIPINSNFSGALSYESYKSGALSEGFSSAIKLNLFSGSTKTFDSSLRIIPTGNIEFLSGATTTQTGTTIKLISSQYPINYELSGSLVGSYSGTLSNTGTVVVELTSGDGDKAVNLKLTNGNGNISELYSAIIKLDQTAPQVSLSADTQTGTVKKSIIFSLSSNDDDFNSGAIAWSNNLNSNTGTGTSYTVTSETSNNLIATANFSDIAGNTGSITSPSYKIDNTAPNTPTNVSFNNGNTVNISNQISVSISGSGGLSNSGAVVNYSITGSSNRSINGSGILNLNSFLINNINISSLSDGNLSYELYFVDTAGNIGNSFSGTSSKQAQIPTGNIQFLSGATTTQTGTTINLLSSEYPVNYELSGSLVGTQSGTLSSSGSIVVELTSGDGDKTVEVKYKDISNNYSVLYSASIKLDQTAPNVIFASHTNNQKVEGNSIILTGSISDLNGVNSLEVNGSPVLLSSSGTWSKSVNLVGGNNVIAYIGKDLPGNISTSNINIFRLPKIKEKYSSVSGTSSVNISFYTDIASTGEILYGTGETNLNFSLNLNNTGTGHNAVILGLNENSEYFYKVRGVINSNSGALSNLGRFKTSKSLDISTLCSTNTALTGSTLLSGGGLTSSGLVSSCNSGNIELSSINSNSSVSLDLSSLTISSNSWDGLFSPPELASFSGSFSGTGYSHNKELTYNIGHNEKELTLSGTLAEIDLDIGSSYNGKNIGVFRSIDKGLTYSYLDSCLVSNSICRFTTNKFSLFTLGTATDNIPDNFSFSPVSGANLNTEVVSNSITISGINTSSIIGISGGFYRINTGAWVNSSGAVNNGDVIEVKVTSSPLNSTSVNAVLSIGGVTSTFNVTTKSVPTGGGGGGSSGGGGGGGGSSIAQSPTCVSEKLVCKLVPGSRTSYKFYKKDGVSCSRGDLGKVCNLTPEILKAPVLSLLENKTLDIVAPEKIKTVRALNEGINFENNTINRIFIKYSKGFEDFDNDLIRLSYIGDDIVTLKINFRNTYSEYLNSLKLVEDSLKNKNRAELKKNLLIFINYHKQLLKHKKSIDKKFGKIYVKKIGDYKLRYIKYKNKKILKIQNILYGKFSKREDNVELYELSNKLLHILYSILNSDALTKSGLKKLKFEGRVLYKNILVIYKSLAKKRKSF